ncbi:hypothetical protein [Sedimentitalea sp.]|uniref:hypothetical protein n=1 Tax=Sedimentitalea sp. TaxID=2048915 RepID=UPI00329875BC
MKPRVAFDDIKLLDHDGNVDDAVFMRFKQELWKADRVRLTPLMEPGRLKREVATNLRLGPVRTEGRAFEPLVKGRSPFGLGRIFQTLHCLGHGAGMAFPT